MWGVLAGSGVDGGRFVEVWVDRSPGRRPSQNQGQKPERRVNMRTTGQNQNNGPKSKQTGQSQNKRQSKNKPTQIWNKLAKIRKHGVQYGLLCQITTRTKVEMGQSRMGQCRMGHSRPCSCSNFRSHSYFHSYSHSYSHFLFYFHSQSYS